MSYFEQRAHINIACYVRALLHTLYFFDYNAANSIIKTSLFYDEFPLFLLPFLELYMTNKLLQMLQPYHACTQVAMYRPTGEVDEMRSLFFLASLSLSLSLSSLLHFTLVLLLQRKPIHSTYTTLLLRRSNVAVLHPSQTLLQLAISVFAFLSLFLSGC